MNKIKMIAAMFIAGILLTFVSCGDNRKSKKISIAYANWSEGIAMTNLAKAIFEDQGYDVKLLILHLYLPLSPVRKQTYLWMSGCLSLWKII